MTDENPKGFRWPRSRKVYHATIALDAIRSEGLKTRSQLAEQIHATGGGPSESVSFTTDIRVAQAICIGLRTLVRIAKRQMLLGDLIIAADKLSAKATQYKVDDMHLTPEKVVQIDRGLYPFWTGMGYGHGTLVNQEKLEAALEAHPERFVDVERDRHEGAKRDYFISGWTTRDVLLQLVKSDLDRKHIYPMYAEGLGFEFYKGYLGYGHLSEHAVYDPLFFMTSPEKMKFVDETQIGIISATLDADWVCADARSARDMGYEELVNRFGYDLGDWTHACEMQLRFPEHSWHGRSPRGSGWGEPSASDTLVYLGQAMAEVRVYDPRIVRGVKLVDDVEQIARDAVRGWDRKGVELDDDSGAIAWPYFESHTPWLAGST